MDRGGWAGRCSRVPRFLVTGFCHAHGKIESSKPDSKEQFPAAPPKGLFLHLFWPWSGRGGHCGVATGQRRADETRLSTLRGSRQTVLGMGNQWSKASWYLARPNHASWTGLKSCYLAVAALLLEVASDQPRRTNFAVEKKFLGLSTRPNLAPRARILRLVGRHSVTLPQPQLHQSEPTKYSSGNQTSLCQSRPPRILGTGSTKQRDTDTCSTDLSVPQRQLSAVPQNVSSARGLRGTHQRDHRGRLPSAPGETG